MTNTEKRIEGFEAIEYAETNGLLLSKYADPIEGFRQDVTAEEARRIAAEDPRLIYVDLPTPMSRPTLQELAQDVAELYTRGHILHLDDRCDNPSVESLRSVLQDAGFTPEQINERDYNAQ